MRLVVAGATGAVGRHVVAQARDAGHAVVPLSRATGQDVLFAAGLADALAGADAVVDVSNVTTTSARAAVAFFRRATANLLAAERAAGVGHHVALSIVGIDAVTAGYYAGKRAQEELVTGSDVPWSLLRATQFHEFAAQMTERAAVGPFVVVPAMTTATVAAAEVATALLAIAEKPAQGRAADLGGPETAELAELVRRYVAAAGLRRRVVRLPLPGRTWRLAREGALVPADGADRGRGTFDEWLAGIRR